MQNGYQQVENDGAVHVASTETVTTGTSSALNTSTEYAFETNLFEDQYYDVNVGSAIGVQSDSQVKMLYLVKIFVRAFVITLRKHAHVIYRFFFSCKN